MIEHFEKKLLWRIALRIERQAKERYDAADKAKPEDVDRARRTRDTELGDVSDLKTFIKKYESKTTPSGAGGVGSGG